jgi:hypothetical protein
LELTMDVPETVEVVAWVLGFGGDAEVLEPAARRATVAAEVRRAAARYRRSAQKNWKIDRARARPESFGGRWIVFPNRRRRR